MQKVTLELLNESERDNFLIDGDYPFVHDKNYFTVQKSSRIEDEQIENHWSDENWEASFDEFHCDQDFDGGCICGGNII